jgi:alcohol dehydrogenase YqhD (iron-dependent ADH family)
MELQFCHQPALDQCEAASALPETYHVFPLLDPVSTMTLPPRQLSDGVFDAITHCIDSSLTGQENPLMDASWLATLKELVDIGPEAVKPGSSLGPRSRLVAASFALKVTFSPGKDGYSAIYKIRCELTVRHNIDHRGTLSIVTPAPLENQFGLRKTLLAKSAEASSVSARRLRKRRRARSSRS